MIETVLYFFTLLFQTMQAGSAFLWDAFKSIGLPVTLLLLGSGIARTWQHRNWITQQRISDQDKVNQETKKLFEDFVELSSKRHFRTKRLYWAIKAGHKKRIEAERLKYDEILYDWNEAELSWKVRFVKNLSNGRFLNGEIEDKVRVPFVVIGGLLEQALRRADGVAAATKSTTLSLVHAQRIETTLNAIAASIFEVGRDIYGRLDYLSQKRLDNDQIADQLLQKGRYDELSLSQLFKVTITSKIDRGI